MSANVLMGGGAQSHLPLKVVVRAVLYFAALREHTETPVHRFYEVFATLANRFPKHFPGLVFTGSPGAVYSKRLDDALNNSFISATYEFRSDGEYLLISSALSKGYLAQLRQQYGDPQVNDLIPVAELFVLEFSASE